MKHRRGIAFPGVFRFLGGVVSACLILACGPNVKDMHVMHASEKYYDKLHKADQPIQKLAESMTVCIDSTDSIGAMASAVSLDFTEIQSADP